MLELSREMSECPQCDEMKVKFSYHEQAFPYGDADRPIQLVATVPIGTCSACGASFTDERAEVLRHEAVCAHLGIFNPREIADLRKRLNLSRSQLAQITKIGEASIARWERGASVQNAALDNLLYLLSQEGNLNKLRARNCRRKAIELKGDVRSTLLAKFSDLDGHIDEVAHQADGFMLNLEMVPDLQKVA